MLPDQTPLEGSFCSVQPKVLCVDEDPESLEALRNFYGDWLDLTVTGDESEAIELLEKNHDYSVVVADVTGSGINGINFLCKAREVSPDTTRIMLTRGPVDHDLAMEAVNRGHIHSILMKPCAPVEFTKAMTSAISQFRNALGAAASKLLD